MGQGAIDAGSGNPDGVDDSGGAVVSAVAPGSTTFDDHGRTVALLRSRIRAKVTGRSWRRYFRARTGIGDVFSSRFLRSLNRSLCLLNLLPAFFVVSNHGVGVNRR